jgi:hypothetical protein
VIMETVLGTMPVMVTAKPFFHEIYQFARLQWE